MLILGLLFPGSLASMKPAGEKPRIIITTDIGGTDPDDNQSMMHYLLYCNEFDCEGLVFPGSCCDTDYKTGNSWWSDRRDPTLYHDGNQGAATIFKHRKCIIEDWGKRCSWLE